MFALVFVFVCVCVCVAGPALPADKASLSFDCAFWCIFSSRLARSFLLIVIATNTVAAVVAAADVVVDFGG